MNLAFSIIELIGAIVMRLTGVHLIDPILSIAIAVYILYRAIRNLIQVFRTKNRASALDWRGLLIGMQEYKNR